MKRFAFIAWTSLGAGLLFAALCGRAALENNNQGEFRDLETGAVHWDQLAPLIAVNFASMTLLMFGALGLGLLTTRGIELLARVVGTRSRR